MNMSLPWMDVMVPPMPDSGLRENPPAYQPPKARLPRRSRLTVASDFPSATNLPFQVLSHSITQTLRSCGSHERMLGGVTGLRAKRGLAPGQGKAAFEVIDVM